MKTFWQTVGFYLCLPFFYVIAMLPFNCIYVISDALYYMAYYVIRYRRQIVADNLAQTFPKKSLLFYKKLEKAFYHHLCDLLLEHLKSLLITPQALNKRCKFSNPDLLQTAYKNGQHIILLSGHQGNWEWVASTLALQKWHTIYAIYKRLKNPHFNNLIARIRQRFGRKILLDRGAFKYMCRYPTHSPIATAILADQMPNSIQNAYMITFLGQPTYVNDELAKVIHRLNFPVFFIDVKKEKRGHYVLEAKLLFEQPQLVTPRCITESYMNHIENAIDQQPATWLWSHRRWKNKSAAENRHH